MKKIISERQTGKTFKLVHESAETNCYIVCSTAQECSRVKAAAMDLKLDIPFPITFYEFTNKRYHGKGIDGFLIDNADVLLQSMTPVRINTITMHK